MSFAIKNDVFSYFPLQLRADTWIQEERETFVFLPTLVYIIKLLKYINSNKFKNETFYYFYATTSFGTWNNFVRTPIVRVISVKQKFGYQLL